MQVLSTQIQIHVGELESFVMILGGTTWQKVSVQGECSLETIIEWVNASEQER